MEIRTLITWIFGVLFAAVLLAVTENFKEWLKQSGGNTLLVRIVDKILPTKLQEGLSWKYLRATWWLWSTFGMSGGIALGLLLSPEQAENIQLKTLAQSNTQDAAKWRFAYYLRYAPRTENNSLLTCKFMLVLSFGDAAWNLWVILQPMLELAHWESYPGPDLSRPETPFQGVTIIAGENKDASACGTALGKSMGEAFSPVHVSFRSNQVSPALTACKNECVELDIGN